MRLAHMEVRFFSFGVYHHDICLVKHHKLKMDNGSMLHFSLSGARPNRIRRHPTARQGTRDSDARRAPDRLRKSPAWRAWIPPPGPRPALDRDHRGAKQTTASFPRSPERPAALCAEVRAAAQTQAVPPSSALTPPTLTGHRFSNKTEDYGVFKPSWIAHIGQVSIYAQDIARSRRWYERLARLAAQPNLRRGGSSVQGGLAHSLLLYERWRTRRMSRAGRRTRSRGQSSPVPVGDEFSFRSAFELEGNTLQDVFLFTEQAHSDGFKNNYGPVRHNSEPPHGDGETGGNVASYFLRSRLSQRRVLRRHGRDRKLSRALR